MSRNETFQDRVSVITGAASGIGRALARELARRGSHLALADVNADGLAETARELQAMRRVTTHVVDVANRKAVHDFAEDTFRQHGRVDAVVNNAGVSVAQTFAETSYEDMEWIVGINLWGVIHGTKAFLPKLVEQKSGWIVNVSSVFGLISVPSQSMYNATKFAVRGLSEALRIELQGSGISVTCVHPGGIKTNIARNSRVYQDGWGNQDRSTILESFDKAAMTTPEEAAKVIVRGMERRSRRVLIGKDAWLIDRTQRALPESYWEVLYPLTEQLRRFSKK